MQILKRQEWEGELVTITMALFCFRCVTPVNRMLD